MKPKFLRGAALATVGLALSPAAASEQGAVAGIRVIDVGQGSAVLLVDHDGRRVMIDSGPYGRAESVIAALSDHAPASPVDLWIHTHFDADHVGGVVGALDGADAVAGTSDDVDVRLVWDRGVDPPPPPTHVVAAYLDRLRTVRTAPDPGETIEVGEIRVTAHYAQGPRSEENELGLALCVQAFGMRMFFPGDLPASLALEPARACGPVDVLLASHHGAQDGTSAALVEALDPGAVVVTAGIGNGYCHPDPQTLREFGSRTVLVTGAAGLWDEPLCPGLHRELDQDHRVEVVGTSLWISRSGQILPLLR